MSFVDNTPAMTPKSSPADLQSVINQMTAVISHSPNDPDAYFRRGNAHSNLAQYPQARDDLQIAIRLDPTNPLAHNNNLGVANLCLGNFDEAVRNTTDAIALDPDYRDAYHNRALARTETGDLHLALADFTRALELDPTYWPAYRHRSVLHHMLGNPKQAYADFLKSRQLAP